MAGVLLEVSEALAATVESAGQGVVRVEARRRLPATGIVWSPDGIIVTAHHVVEQDDAIQVGLPAGQTVTATLIGRDPSTDLAVLRAQATDLTPPAWVAPDLLSLRVGHLVLALGRSRQTVQATLGIVSALGADWRTPVGGQVERYLQTDVVMYPGFSGGPLVDVVGRVVGLNTSALLRGISLTVPVPTLHRVVEMLLVHGRVRRGYLGVSTQPVRLPQALSQQLGQKTGLLLITVEPESPADQGGLLLGDTLVALDEIPIRHPDDLLALLGPERIGAAGLVRLIRSGHVQERRVVIGEHV
jgi:S1-C subfamily serine protease